MIKIGIIGGTGYTGVELLRILATHPEAEVCLITSRGEVGTRVSDLFPSLRGHMDLEFVAPANAALDDCDVVFCATPNGVAMTYAQRLLQAGVRLIDIGADFRLSDQATWEKWYGMEHQSPELLAQAVYGLPEINRDQIRSARLVANPGCYPTAILLGLLPLLENNLASIDNLIADAKSGVSGAGRTAKVSSLMSEVSDNFKAYGVPGHRHQPEIEQMLSMVAQQPVSITFVPHLVPMIRGILATLYATTEASAEELQDLYESRYAAEPFVDVLPPGSHPDTRSVRGANICRIAVHRPPTGNRAIVLSVEDNLVKGAAGQAIQNMNLMMGIDETTGLTTPAVLP